MSDVSEMRYVTGFNGAHIWIVSASREGNSMDHVDRREFLQKTGVATAAAGAVWAAPSVLGSTTAFAAGSTTDPTTPTVPVDTTPCLLFDWGGRSSAPISAAGTGNNSNVQTADDGVTTVAVTSALVGAVPPTTNGTFGGQVYRNMWVHNTPVSGYGTVSGYSDPSEAGLMLIQNNSGGGNADAASVTNYQEVTFAFSAPVTSLTFTIYDLTKFSGYTDLIGFDATPIVIADTAASRPGGASLEGTGSFGDPLRRKLTTDYFISPSDVTYNTRLDLTVRFTGSLSSLKMRYASGTTKGMQFIKIGDMQTGGCLTLPVPGT